MICPGQLQLRGILARTLLNLLIAAHVLATSVLGPIVPLSITQLQQLLQLLLVAQGIPSMPQPLASPSAHLTQHAARSRVAPCNTPALHALYTPHVRLCRPTARCKSGVVLTRRCGRPLTPALAGRTGPTLVGVVLPDADTTELPDPGGGPKEPPLL